MGSFAVVQGEVVVQAGRQGEAGIIFVQVDVFILHGPPEPLDEDVVPKVSSAIHADADLCRQQPIREGQAGQLGALIGVEDRGFGRGQSPVQSIQAEADILGV